MAISNTHTSQRPPNKSVSPNLFINLAVQNCPFSVGARRQTSPARASVATYLVKRLTAERFIGRGLCCWWWGWGFPEDILFFLHTHLQLSSPRPHRVDIVQAVVLMVVTRPSSCSPATSAGAPHSLETKLLKQVLSPLDANPSEVCVGQSAHSHPWCPGMSNLTCTV